MAWIKRNLFFVVAMIVGLALVGAAGYFVYTTISANNDASDQYTSALNDLTTLQQKKPYPSDENIRIAKEDSEHVAGVVKDMNGAFVNFPEPPTVTAEEFISVLNSNLNFFRLQATNANVQLVSPDYTFSFSAEANALSFQGNNFAAWMVQLQQIGAIVKILCDAKVNSLDTLQRAPVGTEDPTGVDYLQNTVTSNQVAIISPYKIIFRGFSEEIAKVLEGFASSPHCFLIKDIQVTPTKGVPLGSAAPGQAAPQYITVPRYVPGGGGFGQGAGGGRRRGFQAQQQPQVEMEQVLVNPNATPTGPVTILKPLPLFVTIVVDAVQMKNNQR